jgi:antirestriction protein ArdC
MSKDTVYEMVTERMITALEAGTVPWQKPWSGGKRPLNLVNGKPYRGVNIFLLHLTALEAGYKSPYWLSFKQAKELGGSVRKGEHGTVIVFWQMVKAKKTDEEEAGKTVPMLRYYRVFNLEQCDGVRIPKGREIPETSTLDFDPITEAETIIAGYKNPPKIVEDRPEAFFRPDGDLVNLPPRATFTDEGEFYSTAFHELTHSTGSEKRLNRHTSKDQFVFGSHDYGREELVAEMGSAFLCAEAGIESTFENSAAYLNGWLRTIKEDRRAVVVAAGAAQRAADYILNRSYKETEAA